MLKIKGDKVADAIDTKPPEITMDKLLAPWKYVTVKAVLQIYDHLRNNSKTMDDLRDYVNNMNDPYYRDRTHTSVICAECGTPMVLYPVNTHPSNQIEGDWNSQWFCQRCGESEFWTAIPRDALKYINFGGEPLSAVEVNEERQGNLIIRRYRKVKDGDTNRNR